MHVPILSTKFDAALRRNDAWKIDYPPLTSAITSTSENEPFSPP